MPTGEPKTEYNDEYVVCPYCGCSHGDAWEWATDGDMECEECGETFTLEIEHSVTYITRAKEATNAD